ncbi:MAG: alkaline shock response membrane anchor protein AmaP [Candidatus Omnitrophota bacterium]|nr:MAG: alkaline shock response membrane anchor protein AmaP [Candidatus Omnitrophota bacterium]
MILIYVLISSAVGVFLVGVALDLINLNLAASYLSRYVLFDMSSKVIVGILGLLIVLLCIRYLQSLLLRSRRERAITFESPDGTVDITLFAIEDMLRRALEDKKEISHIRPKILSRKKGLDVLIRSDLASEVNILDFTREVQQKVKEKLENILGEDKEIKVKMRIRKMVFAGTRRKPEEEPEIPFRNY